MSPAELKRLNVEHFQRVLNRTADPQERARIERFIDEERAKADSAYPADHSPLAAHPPGGKPMDTHPRGDAMIEVHYGVVQIESRWTVIGKGLRLGGYDTRADAEDVVRRIAGQVAGMNVQLHLQDEDGSFHRDRSSHGRCSP